MICSLHLTVHNEILSGGQSCLSEDDFHHQRWDGDCCVPHLPLIMETDVTDRYTTQLGYLDVIVQEKLRSGWPGPLVKVEGCCD
jgi:hypothetical protein